MRNRIQPYEKRYGTENGTEHDIHNPDDTTWASTGKPNGEHAADQRQTGGPGHSHATGVAWTELRGGSATSAGGRKCEGSAEVERIEHLNFEF